MNILIVEDVEEKFNDVARIACEALGCEPSVTRSENLVDAEDALSDGRTWDLLLLDISMDISDSKSFDFSSGHATLGGLDILERMSLLKIHIPTVLVTGFDSFQDNDRFQNSITYLKDVEKLTKVWIGSSYLGIVRYGPTGWDKKLRSILEKWGGRR